MARGLFALLLLLSACAPRPGERGPVLLVPGGRIVGAWAELEGGFPLPGPPILADWAGSRLYLAYPYELDVLEGGELVDSYDLPGIPRFLHARPEPVVGTPEGVFAPGLGFFPYPARDARRREGRIYWTDGDAHEGEARLFAGGFRAVVADRERVAFLGKEARFLQGERFPIPPFLKAELFENLYLLTETGVVAYTPSGLLLAERKGRFSDLAVDARGVWLLTPSGRVLALDPYLEVQR